MTMYYAELTVRVRGPQDEVPEELERSADRVLEQLDSLQFDSLPGVTDADYLLTMRDGSVTFSGFVDGAGDLLEAQKLFVTTVRAAIHAAGESTPGWPTFIEIGGTQHSTDAGDPQPA